MGKQHAVYRMLSYIWRNTLLKWYRNLTDEDRKPRKLGPENPDKIFYVIRRPGIENCGLFSDFILFLGKIEQVLKDGYIPIIDMQNDFNVYLDKDKVGKENAWEYYFKQPLGYSLEDIAHSRHVIMGSTAKNMKLFPWNDLDFLNGKTGELAYWRKLAGKYMQLSDPAREHVESEYQRLFAGEDRILGVLCRGTDYVASRPSHHNIQPTPDEMYARIDEMMQKHGCTKIFLATEDGGIYQKFKEKYGDIIITNTKRYVKYESGYIAQTLYENGNAGREAGMEYLVTIMLLSKCDCLCAGIVSGTGSAILLSEGYREMYLFDMGRYE